MDYTNIRAAIDRGTAADEVPGLALAMIREVAEGQRDLTAVRHPLGFLCFPVRRHDGDGVCVHLWTPGVADTLTTSSMHAHSWDLISYVLYGSLRNQRISVTDAPASPTHRIFEVHSRGDVDELQATGRLVASRTEAEASYGAGQVYVLPGGEFHATLAPPGDDVATVVLGRSRGQAHDLALGPVQMSSHRLTRSHCDAAETVRVARQIAGRLAAG